MGNYMFCDCLSESMELEAQAKARAEELLREMPFYIRTPGALGIQIHRVLYPFSGWAIEADLLYDGEVVRHYESFELLEIDLLFLQMKALKGGQQCLTTLQLWAG